MENKEKVGLSKTDWILSIVGIIILVLLMVLPPVFRIIFEEETVTPNEETNSLQENVTNHEEEIDDSNYTKITCMRQTTYSEYIENSVIILAHQDKLLKIITEEVTNTYLLNSKDSESIYTEAKLSCNNVSDAFYQVTGLNYSCNVTSDSVQVTKKYDLNKFKMTTVTDNENKEIQFNSPFIYNQDIDQITLSLTSEGYTCQ